MERTWRRQPEGGGLRHIEQRLNSANSYIPARRDFMRLTPGQYEDALRLEGCSEEMIEQELEQFRRVKDEQYRGVKVMESRREARRTRSLGESLDPYVEAELRRLEGTVFEGMKQEIEDDDKEKA